jgi:SnoaL-like protein
VKPDLPAILDRYFAAQNALNAEAMTACFAPDARVRDEGRDYGGRDAILEWKRATIAKYGISIAPLEVSAGEARRLSSPGLPAISPAARPTSATASDFPRMA